MQTLMVRSVKLRYLNLMKLWAYGLRWQSWAPKHWRQCTNLKWVFEATKTTKTNDEAVDLLILDSDFDNMWEMHWCKWCFMNINNIIYTDREAWVTERRNLWRCGLKQGVRVKRNEGKSWSFKLSPLFFLKYCMRCLGAMEGVDENTYLKAFKISRIWTGEKC